MAYATPKIASCGRETAIPGDDPVSSEDDGVDGTGYHAGTDCWMSE